MWQLFVQALKCCFISCPTDFNHMQVTCAINNTNESKYKAYHIAYQAVCRFHPIELYNISITHSMPKYTVIWYEIIFCIHSISFCPVCICIVKHHGNFLIFVIGHQHTKCAVNGWLNIFLHQISYFSLVFGAKNKRVSLLSGQLLWGSMSIYKNIARYTTYTILFSLPNPK